MPTLELATIERALADAGVALVNGIGVELRSTSVAAIPISDLGNANDEWKDGRPLPRSSSFGFHCRCNETIFDGFRDLTNDRRAL
jgi:hypothetical protein